MQKKIPLYLDLANCSQKGMLDFDDSMRQCFSKFVQGLGDVTRTCCKHTRCWTIFSVEQMGGREKKVLLATGAGLFI